MDEDAKRPILGTSQLVVDPAFRESAWGRAEPLCTLGRREPIFDYRGFVLFGWSTRFELAFQRILFFSTLPALFFSLSVPPPFPPLRPT